MQARLKLIMQDGEVLRSGAACLVKVIELSIYRRSGSTPREKKLTKGKTSFLNVGEESEGVAAGTLLRAC